MHLHHQDYRSPGETEYEKPNQSEKPIMIRLKSILVLVIGVIAFACQSTTERESQPNENSTRIKQLAEEAYIFAYPMLEHYKMMFAMAMYPESGAYTAPFNVLHSYTELSGPEDTIIVRPNNDTFYSAVWMDLSEKPQVLSVPAITDGRYYAFQIIDMYTHNIDYVGTRATGFEAGDYLFVGPDWEGEVPEGISEVIRSETNYLLALCRTQVFGPDDVEEAIAVMEEYSVLSLDVYNGLMEAAVIPQNPDIPPFRPGKFDDVNFIAYFNALMGQVELHDSEKEMFDRFAQIGIEPGASFDPASLDSSTVKAINAGVESAMAKIEEESMKLGERKNGWQLISGAFGNREAMQGKYLRRAAAAYFGLWGNDLEEAFYPETTFDADREKLDGSKHNYILHFDADELPPAKAFWSITMYKLPEQLLIANEIDRYIVSSNTEGLKYNEDGSLDVYIQDESPDEDLRSNWLPAHQGPFSLQMRIYWPEPKALDPLYTPPMVVKKDG